VIGCSLSRQRERDVKESLKRYANLLIKYLGPYGFRVMGLALLLFTSTGLRVINPQYLSTFIDAAQAGEAMSRLLQIGLTYLAFGLIRRVLSVSASYLSTDLGWRATNALRFDLAAHCLSLDLPFHKAHTPGQLIERIDGDVLALANFFSQFVIRIAGSVLLLLGVLIALFMKDWRLGLPLTLFALASLGILLRLRQLAISESTDERQQSANLFGFIEERLTSLDDIRSNGAGAYVMRRFHQTIRDYTNTSTHAWIKRSLVWLTSMALYHAGEVLTCALGVVLYFSNRLSLGVVFLVSYYFGMLFHPIEMLAQQLQDFQKAAAGMRRAQEILDVKQEVLDGPTDTLPEGALGVWFENVSFVYEDGDQRVLSQVDFSLRPGTSVGLLGRTGSGKTTLSRLLFRLYDPSTGNIHLAGTNLRDLTLRALRRRVGMVTQDVELFHATVRDNLTLFDDSIPDEMLLAILEDLGLSAWYASLPDGLDTLLEASGSGLSAGEAQLLAFARVFLKDPGLVILDEPSSRLDPVTEHLIERAMERLLRNRTAIIIAHRLGTVQRVDEIMIMDDGAIIEHGPRADLASNPSSRFYRLLQTGLEESFA